MLFQIKPIQQIFFLFLSSFTIFSTSFACERIILIHGLNNSSHSMNDIALEFPQIKSILVSLHSPQDEFSAFTPENALQHVSNIINPEWKNLCIIGYSLGGAIALKLASELNAKEQIVTKLYLIAPAIKLTWKRNLLSILPNFLIVPSFIPENIRAYRWTPISAYSRTEKFARELSNNPPKINNTKIRLALEQNDELIDYDSTVEWIKIMNLGWEVFTLPTPENTPVKHTLIRKEDFSDQAWSIFMEDMRLFFINDNH